MTDKTYAIVTEKGIRTWQELPDFRFIMAVQGHQTLGPALQRAWRCMEDGAVEWRTIPTTMLSASEYFAAVGEPPTLPTPQS